MSPGILTPPSPLSVKQRGGRGSHRGRFPLSTTMERGPGGEVFFLAFAFALSCSSGSGQGSVVCSGNCDCQPPSSVCIDGRCADGCGASGCPEGAYCDTGSGLCFPEAPKSCQRDLDCGPPDRICVQGLCAPGCALTCCFGGTLCNGETGYCVNDPRYGCRNDRECEPPTTTCVEGRCLTPEFCMADVDCDGPVKICDGGLCLDGCLTHGCPDGSICDGATGRCRAGRDVDVVEPPDAEPADTSTPDDPADPPDPGAVDVPPSSCSNDTHCNVPLTVCEQGHCVPGCLTVACPAGQSCDQGLGRCHDAPVTCAADAACTPPATICQAGACVPGCSTSGCPSGVDCNASTGHCLHKKNLGDLCTSGSECTTGMCIEVAFTTGASYFVCVLPCCSGSDCPVGFGCLQQPGVKFCIPATLYPGATFQVADGGPCVNATQCQSGSCSFDADGGRCVETCCTTDDCALAPIHTCQGYSADASSPFLKLCDLDPTQYHYACLEYPNCTVPPGQPCQSSYECTTLMCDDMYGTSGHLCADFCCSNVDCPAGTSCRMYAEESPGFTHPMLTPLCLKDGGVPVGQACTYGSDCLGGDCVASTCRQLCCSEADCPGGQTCRLDLKNDVTSGLSSYVTVCQ